MKTSFDLLMSILSDLDRRSSKVSNEKTEPTTSSPSEDTPEQDPDPKVEGMPAQSSNDDYEAIIDILAEEVLPEVLNAIEEHAPMNSPHEGISVIREEFEELWEEVKNDEGQSGAARKEAVQLAAMAVRYLLDLDPHN